MNNGITISVRISDFTRLKKAKQAQLDSWKLISKGIGIEWPALDEDLSLKGLIRAFSLQNTLRYVAGENFSMAA